jgi:hypothetical protein
MGEIHQVTGVLNYLAPMAEKPVYYPYPYEVPEGVTRYNAAFDPHAVAISDMRAARAPHDLHRHGFCLQASPTAVRDFYDEAEIAATYLPEVERLVKAVSGAAAVTAFQHTRRGRDADARNTPFERVHNDFSLSAGEGLLRAALGERAEAHLGAPFMIVNVWRPIRGPLRDAPLALCDARSVKPRDLVPTDLKYPDGGTECYEFNYSPDHAWWYAPDMTPDEALVFKTFDSVDAPGRARFAPHTAFFDTTAHDHVPPRESIEVRTFAFF